LQYYSPKKQLKLEKKLICIGGPTASGKTALALALARHYSTVILSVDSRQVYKHFNIGTAKPSLEERKNIPHHFIDIVDPFEKYSAGIFERQANETLTSLFDNYNIVIAAGGTGFFFKALLEGLDTFPELSEERVKQLNIEYTTKGLEPLKEELLEKDPHYAEKVDLQNPLRVIRALSVIRSSGKPFSEFFNKKPANTKQFTPICFALFPEREQLYANINQRVEQMIQSGLEEEVRNLLLYKNTYSFNTVGYKEWLPYFEGRASREDTLESIQRNTRRYAKRQYTWFQNQGNWIPTYDPSPQGIILAIDSLINSNLTK
jgi:tRNA dimethylallyltransferase